MSTEDVLEIFGFYWSSFRNGFDSKSEEYRTCFYLMNLLPTKHLRRTELKILLNDEENELRSVLLHQKIPLECVSPGIDAYLK